MLYRAKSNSELESIAGTTVVSGDTSPIGTTMLYDGKEIPTGWQEVKDIYYNDNLLINSDFRNPINQRGLKEYNTNSGNAYTVDRWRANKTTVTINESSITLKNNTETYQQFIQPFEVAYNKNIYTVSTNVIDVTGNIIFRYFDVNEQYHNQSVEDSFIEGINIFTINDSVKVLGILLYPKSSITIEWIKLEQSEMATPLLQVNYDEELRKCERFYNNKSTLAFGIISGASFFGYIPMATQMRNMVVGNVKDSIFTINCNGTTYTPNISSIIAVSPRYGGMWVGFRFINATIPNKTMSMIESLRIEFDAEIY